MFIKGRSINKSYIWTLPTRIFHWLFVIFILITFFTDDDDLLVYHAIIGYALIILLTFRLGWGFIGPKYSLFKDFPLGKDNVNSFLVNIFDEDQKYIGHNPIAAYVMIAIFLITFIIIITGSLTFGIQEEKGIFKFLSSGFFKSLELFEGLHELFSNLLIALIIAHLLGIFTDKILHSKHETLQSIFTGYKQSQNNESIKTNLLQKIFSFVMFSLLVIFIYYCLSVPNNILLQ